MRRSRAHAMISFSTSQSGSCPPRSRCGNSSSRAPTGSEIALRSSSVSRALLPYQDTVEPVQPLVALSSRVSRRLFGWKATVHVPAVKPRCAGLFCWHIVPLGIKTGASFRNNAATSLSKPATRSPFHNGLSPIPVWSSLQAAEHLTRGLGIIVCQKVVTGLVDLFRLGSIEQHVFLPFTVLQRVRPLAYHFSSKRSARIARNRMPSFFLMEKIQDTSTITLAL